MPKNLLAQITINGTLHRLSTESVSASQYYKPFLLKAPDVRLAVESGLGRVQVGTLQLRNDPHDSESLWRFADESYPPAPGLAYSIRLDWGEQENPLFEGTAVIREFDDVMIELDLLEPEYPQEILYECLDHSAMPVTACSAANPMQITAAGHGLQSGDIVIFEGLNLTTQLNYSEATPTRRYPITVTGADTFTLDGINSTSGFTTGTNSAGRVGKPVLRPLAFGSVTHRLLTRTDATPPNPGVWFVNPSLVTSPLPTVYDDGVAVTVVSADAQRIRLNEPVKTEQVSVSGTSTLPVTLAGVVGYLVGRLGLVLDTSKAPAASTQTVAVYISDQKTVLEALGELLAATNHAVEIWNGTAYLIDWGQAGNSTMLHETLWAGKPRYLADFPVKSFKAEWQAREPVTLSGVTHLSERTHTVTVANAASGQDETREAFSESDAQVKTWLTAIKAHQGKYEVRLPVAGLQVGYRLGDWFKFTDSAVGVTVVFVLTGLAFDFEKETTELSGRATLTKIVRS